MQMLASMTFLKKSYLRKNSFFKNVIFFHFSDKLYSLKKKFDRTFVCYILKMVGSEYLKMVELTVKKYLAKRLFRKKLLH